MNEYEEHWKIIDELLNQAPTIRSYHNQKKSYLEGKINEAIHTYEGFPNENLFHIIHVEDIRDAKEISLAAVYSVFRHTLTEATIDKDVSDDILSKMRKEYQKICGDIKK